jgi:hypothetical protein
MEKKDDELRPPTLVFRPIRLNIRKMRNGELNEDDSVDDNDTDSCSTPLSPPPLPGIA